MGILANGILIMSRDPCIIREVLGIVLSIIRGDPGPGFLRSLAGSLAFGIPGILWPGSLGSLARLLRSLLDSRDPFGASCAMRVGIAAPVDDIVGCPFRRVGVHYFHFRFAVAMVTR